MKKLLTLVALVAALSLTSCFNKTETPAETNEAANVVTSTGTAEVMPVVDTTVTTSGTVDATASTSGATVMPVVDATATTTDATVSTTDAAVSTPSTVE